MQRFYCEPESHLVTATVTGREGLIMDARYLMLLWVVPIMQNVIDSRVGNLLPDTKHFSNFGHLTLPLALSQAHEAVAWIPPKIT